MLHITILTDPKTWMNRYVPELIEKLTPHSIRWIHDTKNLEEGDILFMLSFERIIKKESLEKHRSNIVIHPSDLPKGKGWSPLAWQVLEGKNEIPITLFEAAESLDAGDYYYKDTISLRGDERIDELHDLQARKNIELCMKYVSKFPEIMKSAQKQSGQESFYEKRTAESNLLDPSKSIQEQFDLFRIADNDHYPVHFYLRDCHYKIAITKCDS